MARNKFDVDEELEEKYRKGSLTRALGYAKPYAADSRKLIAIGINFSSEKGTIDGFLPKEILHGK